METRLLSCLFFIYLIVNYITDDMRDQNEQKENTEADIILIMKKIITSRKTVLMITFYSI